MGGKGGMFGSPAKVKGFEQKERFLGGEEQAFERQKAIASGAAPSIAQQQYGANLDELARQGMSMAASQRGASNPALAFREAQLAQQQAGLQAAQQGGIMAEQERRAADQFLASVAAGQRGTALQQSQQNVGAQTQAQGQKLGFLGALGASGASMFTGKAYGGVVDGEEVVEGDSPANDTEPHMLSAGEIVIPKSAAKDKESAIKFLESVKFGDSKSGKDGEDLASGMAKLLEEMRKLNKNLSKGK